MTNHSSSKIQKSESKILNIIDTAVWLFSEIYQNRVRPFLLELWYLRVAVISVILSYIFYSSVGQSLDIYAELALNFHENWPLVLISAASIITNAFIIWIVSRSLLDRLYHREESKVADLYQQRKQTGNKTPQEKNSFFFFCILYWGIFWEIYRRFNLLNVLWVFFSIVLFLLVETFLVNPSSQENLPEQGNIGSPFFWLSVSRKKAVDNIGQSIRNWVSNSFIPPNKNQDSDENLELQQKSAVRAANWLPRILGLIPLISLGSGMLKASSMFTDGEKEAQTLLLVGSAFLFFLIIPILLRFFTYRKLNSSQRELLSVDRDKGLFSKKLENILGAFSAAAFLIVTLPLSLASSSLIGVTNVLIVLILSVGLLILWNVENLYRKEKRKIIFSLGLVFSVFGIVSIRYFSGNIITSSWLVRVTSLFGPLAIISIFLICFLSISSTVFDWGTIKRLPALTVALVLAVIYSFFNLNDNHQLRMISLKLDNSVTSPKIEQTSRNHSKKLKTLESAFSEWLEQEERKREIDKFKQSDKVGPYPI